jgi:tetratricopeptide (TPR) repeat protein
LVYEERGEIKKAVDFLFLKLQMRKTGGIDKEEWLEVGHKYFNIGEFQSASYCCQRSLKLKPRWLIALKLKILCYEKLENEKGMISFLERYVENGGISDKSMVEKLAKLYNLQSRFYVKL